MLAKVKSAAVVGLEGAVVEVEVDLSPGLPSFTKDGGLGDDDLTADGTIVDQGAPGNPGSVGWEIYPVIKVHVLLPWIAPIATIIVAVRLMVLRRRGRGRPQYLRS